MILEFTSELIEWRGPAPYLFASVPPELSAEIKMISSQVSYGWGVIPVFATIGVTEYRTSLFPRNGVYLVPAKMVVQRAEKLEVGQVVGVKLEIGRSPRAV